MRWPSVRQLSPKFDILRGMPPTFSTLSDWREAFLGLPLLAALSLEQRVALADAVTLREYLPGTALIALGAAEHDLLFLLSGEARVVVGGQPVALLPSGSLIGELGFFERYPSRSADVLAETACRAAVLTREAYAALPVAASAGLEHAILGVLSLRLHGTNAQIVQLLAEQRPASMLARLRRWLSAGG